LYLVSWKETGIENSLQLHRNPKVPEEVVLLKLKRNQMKMQNRINQVRNQKLADPRKAHPRKWADHMIQTSSLKLKKKDGGLNKTFKTSFKITFLKSKSRRRFNLSLARNT